ncbi:MAG: respiratory nitrate reductase subunit gamma [Bacteroidales bacterium]|nr:respiratory nitrate reductase subunit gamma [Bacteroidota bacterium]MBL6949176.1 respiratory nitrate reductase subunit gamma [Bacteroidales bacterium]
MSNFFFIGLPYASIVIMLIGTIYRYRSTEFEYSSLSSQFLESKTLYKGVRPFHWGIIFLFFAHLIGFLFPRTVLAWNGDVLRLLIIEIGAFGFGLLTLWGLIILIIRRLRSRRTQIVTSKMDVVVYIILLVEVVTGLLSAYLYRWGSSWFASAMTPYLKSLFLFSPDTAALQAMPLLVQIHVVSAFSMFALIPFTRFVHFLVYPIWYFFRGYQRVVWNWDRNQIRNSDKMNFGKPPENN